MSCAFDMEGRNEHVCAASCQQVSRKWCTCTVYSADTGPPCNARRSRLAIFLSLPLQVLSLPLRVICKGEAEKQKEWDDKEDRPRTNICDD